MPDGGQGGRPVIEFLGGIAGIGDLVDVFDQAMEYSANAVVEQFFTEYGELDIDYARMSNGNYVANKQDVDGYSGGTLTEFELKAIGQRMLDVIDRAKRPELDRYYVSAERHEFDYLRRSGIINAVALVLATDPVQNYREFVYRKAFRKAIEAQRRFRRCVPAESRKCLESGGLGEAGVLLMEHDYMRAAYQQALIRWPETAGS